MSNATGHAEQQAASDLLRYVSQTARLRDRHGPKARASLPWRASEAGSDEIIVALTRYLFASRAGCSLDFASVASVCVGTDHAMLETDDGDLFVCRFDRGEDDAELEEEIAVWIPQPRP